MGGKKEVRLLISVTCLLQDVIIRQTCSVYLHAVRFGELAVANFLHSIRLAKVSVANLANAVLQGFYKVLKSLKFGYRFLRP